MKTFLLMITLVFSRHSVAPSSVNMPINTPLKSPAFVIYEPITNMGFAKYQRHMAKIEGGNDYKIWNCIKVKVNGQIKDRYHFGYYQISEDNLRYFGYNFTIEEFKANPDIFPPWEQDNVFVKLMKYNKRILKKYIHKYAGTWFNGIYITKAGILAAAHLGGSGSVMWFFDNNYVAKDLHNTSVCHYMVEFGRYKI
jgi:hypothetical protein